MTNPWCRMDQLLKCGVCSTKYRNPKLLPCNHTFCSEPCLEKLVDRCKQQLKCPECSSEHRVPHGGVHAFPNNVTLGRFLELRQQVSGREPELPPSMQKCNTCKEKGQLEMCAHCNRKVCKDCKTAHVNILRKEIALINDQVRQGLKHLSGILHKTEQKADNLQKNYEQVKDEIEEVVRRYTKDLYDTEAKLKHDLDSYLQTELRSMQRLEHDLQVEMNNVNSNCDLVDKYVNNGVDWTDAELTDYKDIFLKTLDFLRTFDSDPLDCLRKVKFHPRADPDVVHKTLIDFAEVKLSDDVNNNNIVSNGITSNGIDNLGTHQGNGPSVTLTPPQLNAIARSQSDNRLANQRRLESGRNTHEDNERETTYSRRRFVRDRDSCERELNARDDREYLGVSSWRRELDEVRSNSNQKNRFGSREYMDDQEHSEKEPSPSRRGVRFEEKPSFSSSSSKGRDYVNETEDATKGPLSGVIKILDSPHVMERLHHSEVRQKKLKEEEDRKAKQPPPPPPRINRSVNRQLSEDEIEKQKKENKAAAAAAAASNPTPTSTTHKEKSSALSDTRPRPRTGQDNDISSLTSLRRPPFRSTDIHTEEHKVKSPEESNTSRRRTFEEELAPVPTPRLRPWRTTTTASAKKDIVQSPPGSPTRGIRDAQKPPLSPKQKDPHPLVRPPSRSCLTKSSSLDHDDRPPETSPLRRPLESIGRTSSLDQKESSTSSRPRLRLDMPPQRSVTTVDTSESSSSDSESSADSDTATRRGDISPSVNTLLARSAQARKQSASTQARLLGRQDDDKKRVGNRSWRDPPKKDDDYRDGRGSPRRRMTTIIEPEERTSPYSKLLADRRRGSLASSSRYGRDESPEDRFRNDSSYSAARRNRIARSKSSHDLLPGDDSPDEDTISAIRNRYRTRRSKEKSPEESTNSWSQYLKNKYGNNRSSGGSTSSALVRSRTSSVLGPRSGSDNSSDEESLTNRRRGDFRRHGDSNSPRSFSMPRRTYMAKGKPVLKIGSRGTEPGHFTWPRGVCVGPDNTIVVADSSNHRIQVFHSTGKLIQEFGSYGSNEGEFDCLAAVTVNRIGQFIVSDRYNHRIQVFDPSGRFVRTFGSEGRGDGKFSYPWGVATDNLGFIYVCDKENHRIQVFQGDGTYVTRFGSIGQRAGELEHPHYVAVSSTNRVIVSDSNNHRIQIFDVNGRLLSGFGSEGSDEGQFKYPRGVAVDDQGYLIVGDSGNNRIQVFHPDGTFLKSFGTWGSGDGEFKGLEGIAVSPSGQIMVCDRENHRIQVF